jgi:diguanylate cyclase (GGDEF)-like protein/PAS domain S-box-containing protein
MLIERGFRHLIVVDRQGCMMGIVTEGDFLRHLEAGDLSEFKSAEKVMSRNILTVDVGDTLSDAISIMSKNRYSCVVVTREQIPCGILTERDLVRLAPVPDIGGMLVGSLVHAPLITVPPSISLPDAIKLMERHKVSHLVVTEQDKLLGLVTRHDLVKTLQGSYVHFLSETIQAQRNELFKLSQQRILFELHDEALAAADNAILIADKQAVIQWANPAFSRLTGYMQEEVVGNYIRDIAQSGEQSKAFYEAMWKTMLDGRVWHGEIINKRKDGTLYHEEMTITPVRIKSEDITHFIAVKQDITERKHAEQTVRESWEKYRLLTENAEEVIWSLDPQTLRFLYVSPSVYKLRGYQPEEILAEPMDAALAPDSAALMREKVKRRLAALQAGTETLGTFYTNELEQHCKDGSTVWTEVVTNWYLNKKTNQYEIRGVTRDISKRKKVEADLKLAHDAEIIKNEQLKKTEKILRESEKHIRVLFNSGNDPIFVYEIDSISGAPLGNFIEVNDVACSRLGFSRDELLRMQPTDIIAPEAATHPVPNLKIAYNRKAVYESAYLTRAGQSFPVEVNAHVFELYDKRLVFAMARDITERKKAEADLKLAHAEIALRNAELEHISITDRLTGLFNRRKLDDVLIQEMERVTRYGEDLSVIIADIDMFKSVNDLYGHLAGDIVLITIAKVLQNGVRKTDIPGRWGGEEFLIICPNSNLEGATALAEHLRQMVETKEYDFVGQKTCSFGVSQMTNEEPINAMIARADKALYRAKEGGRNRVEVDVKSS